MTWTNCSNSQTDWRRFANNCWWIYKHKQIADTLQNIWATWLYPGYILHQSKVAEHLCDFAVNHFPGLISVSKVTRFWIFSDVSCLSKFLFNVNLRVQPRVGHHRYIDFRNKVSDFNKQNISYMTEETLKVKCSTFFLLLRNYWYIFMKSSLSSPWARLLK